MYNYVTEKLLLLNSCYCDLTIPLYICMRTFECNCIYMKMAIILLFSQSSSSDQIDHPVGVNLCNMQFLEYFVQSNTLHV